MNDIKNQIDIVLVETSHPGNIGSVARAMKTMGLKNLILVNPKEFPSKEAFMLSGKTARCTASLYLSLYGYLDMVYLPVLC